MQPIIAQLERAAGFSVRTAPAKAESCGTTCPRRAAGGRRALLADSCHYRLKAAPRLSARATEKERDVRGAAPATRELARQQPVLMILEDAHWIDPSSPRAARSRRRPGALAHFLVVSSAPICVAVDPPGARHDTDAHRLIEHQGVALVAVDRGNKALPDEIVAEIVERTRWRPAVRRGADKVGARKRRDDDGADAVKATPALAVPGTLHAC